MQKEITVYGLNEYSFLFKLLFDTDTQKLYFTYILKKNYKYYYQEEIEFKEIGFSERYCEYIVDKNDNVYVEMQSYGEFKFEKIKPEYIKDSIFSMHKDTLIDIINKIDSKKIDILMKRGKNKDIIYAKDNEYFYIIDNDQVNILKIVLIKEPYRGTIDYTSMLLYDEKNDEFYVVSTYGLLKYVLNETEKNILYSIVQLNTMLKKHNLDANIFVDANSTDSYYATLNFSYIRIACKYKNNKFITRLCYIYNNDFDVMIIESKNNKNSIKLDTKNAIFVI